MQAVSINQIRYILHFKENFGYIKCDCFYLLHPQKLLYFLRNSDVFGLLVFALIACTDFLLVK